jgi:NADP-dependent 3-hydroxy acid dehydrogenase YdfG
MLAAGERVVMISGANRGIGAATARRLAAGGYRLSLGVRNGKTPAVPASEHCLAARYEARERESAKAWVDATLERFGRIDALVNNAGIARDSTIEDESEDTLDEMWLVNVKAPLRVIRAALPHLKKSGTGRVVNIASLSGKRVKNAHAGYAMTKFALMALTHSVRRLGWEHGIRATAICPSFVATDMTADVQDVDRAEMIPPAEIGELVATVLSLPNNAAVAELLVNMRYEEML